MYNYGEVDRAKPERVKAVLIFNKLNGVFLSATTIGIELCDVNSNLCIYLEDMIDLQNDVVEGGLKIAEDGTWSKDYKILAEHETKQTVYESELDTQVAYKITKRYPVIEQVNILARAINKLAKEHGVEMEEMDELLDYIRLVKDTSKVHKKFYQESEHYDYISNRDEENLEVSKFEGGLHEATGPRTISGGRIFSTHG